MQTPERRRLHGLNRRSWDTRPAAGLSPAWESRDEDFCSFFSTQIHGLIFNFFPNSPSSSPADRTENDSRMAPRSSPLPQRTRYTYFHVFLNSEAWDEGNVLCLGLDGLLSSSGLGPNSRLPSLLTAASPADQRPSPETFRANDVLVAEDAASWFCSQVPTGMWL